MATETENLRAADRNLYRLQESNTHLCESLRSIAEYENDDNDTIAHLGKVARRALNRRITTDLSGMDNTNG